MRLAEQLHVPILILLDTPGAYPGLEAEQRGQGWVIAESIQKMFSIKTPIIVLIIGEGCSGGALGMGVGDVVGMLEHAYYSVISPEGCASILWKDAGKKQEAANALKLNAENLLDLNIVDEVIPEPLGGAHYDPESMFTKVKALSLARRGLFATSQKTFFSSSAIPNFASSALSLTCSLYDLSDANRPSLRGHGLLPMSSSRCQPLWQG